MRRPKIVGKQTPTFSCYFDCQSGHRAPIAKKMRLPFRFSSGCLPVYLAIHFEKSLVEMEPINGQSTELINGQSTEPINKNNTQSALWFGSGCLPGASGYQVFCDFVLPFRLAFRLPSGPFRTAGQSIMCHILLPGGLPVAFRNLPECGPTENRSSNAVPINTASNANS